MSSNDKDMTAYIVRSIEEALAWVQEGLTLACEAEKPIVPASRLSNEPTLRAMQETLSLLIKQCETLQVLARYESAYYRLEQLARHPQLAAPLEPFLEMVGQLYEQQAGRPLRGRRGVIDRETAQSRATLVDA